MKQKTKAIVLVILLMTTRLLFAQNKFVKQVIVLNEGRYDYTNQIQTVPVTLGTYNPQTKTYLVFDTITGARFGTDLLIENNILYVAADKFLLKYDLNTLQRTAIKIVNGIRKLSVWNNQILVSRGEYQITYDAYFQVYDKNNLSLIYQLDTLTTGIKYASEGMVVKNDSAYLIINNGFDWGNYTGLLGIIDLNQQTFKKNIDLGGGLNPENIMLMDNQIYTLNNHDFSTSSISQYSIGNSQLQNFPLLTTSGCNSSMMSADKIYFQPACVSNPFCYPPDEKRMMRFSTQNNKINDTLMVGKNFYGIDEDTVNALIYGSETDFLSWGKVFIYENNGIIRDSFSVSVSPGNFAFDVRNTTGILSIEKQEQLNLFAYPIPAIDEIQIVCKAEKNELIKITLVSVLGQELIRKQINANTNCIVSLNDLAAGVYLLKAETGNSIVTQLVVKK